VPVVDRALVRAILMCLIYADQHRRSLRRFDRARGRFVSICTWTTTGGNADSWPLPFLRQLRDSEFHGSPTVRIGATSWSFPLIVGPDSRRCAVFRGAGFNPARRIGAGIGEAAARRVDGHRLRLFSSDRRPMAMTVACPGRRSAVDALDVAGELRASYDWRHAFLASGSRFVVASSCT